jgi:hypothetical protein
LREALGLIVVQATILASAGGVLVYLLDRRR